MSVKAGSVGFLKMIYYIYILKSIDHEKTYVGFTQDLEKRLKEHNAGKSTYTRKFRPWKLIYREETCSKEIALKLEKYYKSSAGRRKIKKLLAPVAQQDRASVS